jgi:hypothetical protein
VSGQYGALIVANGTKPRWVSLGSATNIEPVIAKFGVNVRKRQKSDELSTSLYDQAEDQAIAFRDKIYFRQTNVEICESSGRIDSNQRLSRSIPTLAVFAVRPKIGAFV